MKIKQFFLWMFLAATCVCFRTAESQAALNLDGSVYINEENFPDQTFRDYIRSVWDKDGDSRITKDELEKITYIWIDCDDEKATSIEGIEFFSNLQEVAIVGYRNMKGTLKKNKQLRSVYISPGTDKCSYEIESKELEESFPLHQITTLKINRFSVRDLPLSKMKNLKALKIYDAAGVDAKKKIIKKLVLSQNKKLEELVISGMYVTKLDLRNNHKLRHIQITPSGEMISEADELGSWYDYCHPFWVVPEHVKSIKLLLPDKNNIEEIQYCTRDKMLDVSKCKKLKRIEVGVKTTIKLDRKWFVSVRGKKLVMQKERELIERIRKSNGKVYLYMRSEEGEDGGRKRVKIPKKGKYMYI